MTASDLPPLEREVALFIAKGLPNHEIVGQTGQSSDAILPVIEALESKMDGGRGVALSVVTNILTAQEMPEWVSIAEENRQRLFDAQAIDYTRARLMLRLANRSYWTATFETLGRLEGVSAPMVEYEIGHLTRVLGSLITVQVTFCFLLFVCTKRVTKCWAVI